MMEASIIGGEEMATGGPRASGGGADPPPWTEERIG
jgi:hypothetical protein